MSTREQQPTYLTNPPTALTSEQWLAKAQELTRTPASPRKIQPNSKRTWRCIRRRASLGLIERPTTPHANGGISP